MTTNQAPTFDSKFDNLDVSGNGPWMPNMPWASLDGKQGDDPSEAGFYVNPNFAPLASVSPFSVTNGVLDLATKPVSAGIDPSLVNNKPFTSGLLQTSKSFGQLYGYFEMRAELPTSNGVGAAFWLMPTDGSWPPELDVMENLGQDPSTVFQTVQGGTSSNPINQQQVAATVPGGVANGFHTYGVDWEADKITFYLDGKQTGQFDTPASMHKPMYMILSDNSTPAFDANWGKPVDGSTKFPADFKVDYVRAYASLPDLSSGGSPAPGGGTAIATPGGAAVSGGTGTSGPPTVSATPSPTVTTPTTTSPAGSVGSVAPTQGTSTMASSISTAPAPSARGGSLLPSGYLSTSGNQVVDAAGNPVRIDSIGWYGTDGPAGSALQGLWSTSYGQILDSIKQDGFNTVRIPWSNADLNTPFAGTNQLGGVDWSQNADLKGLTTLHVFQKIVGYAGQIGLKVIFDHHTDDGSGGQQPNGLWIDKGPGTNGTDGAGVQGTVDAAKFQADWVQFAKTFAGNPTVIGYDLDNEPTAQSATWGGGGATDIQKMYTDVGNAVEAADPGALVIAEGLITPDGQGGYPQTLAGVKSNPVKLNTPDKVLYSVHSYPAEIGGGTDASGPAAVKALTDNWGYVVGQNIAPVWVGEMGSNMTSPGSQTWAKTLLGYMNGQDGAQGGPTFSGSQQPIGGSWWNIGWENGAAGTGAGGGNPDGNQDAWGPGHYRPLQQAVTDQMLFKPGSSTAAPATAATNSAPSSTGSTTPIAPASSAASTVGPAVSGSSTGSANPGPAASGSSTPPPPPASSTGVAAANPVSTSAAGSIAPAAVGTGADTVVLNLSEDAYQGDAQFQFTVDGKGVGPAQSVTALHGKGQSEAFTFKGDWSGAHAFGVTFTNDTWGGTDATDRNLYIDGATFDGTAVQGAAALYGNGTVTSGTTASQPLQAGATNPAGPSPAGTVPSGSATPPAPVGTGADTLVLALSETAAKGDAQFTLTIDGKPVGTTQSVTAAHGQGQPEVFAFKGDWGTGSHTVGVSFANPVPGSTADLARSLYLDSASYDGTPVHGSTQVMGTGPVTFALTPIDTLMVTDNDGSSAAVPLVASGPQTDHPGVASTVQQSASNGTDTITSSGTAKGEALTLGGGTRKLVLVNPRQMVLTGGSGADTVTVDSGVNRFVAGTGSLDITGGPGAAAYVLHAGGGSLTVENFDAGKGDTLTVDAALRGALTQVSDGHGGTLIGFGVKQGSIDLINLGTVSPSNIQFI